MLEGEGLLQREPNSRYAPASDWSDLDLYRRGLDVAGAAMRFSDRSHSKIGEICTFGVMAGSHAV